MKKALSFLLAAALLLGMLPAAFSTAASVARLYNVYDDGMIFRQNDEAVFAGTAAPGARIGAVLKDSAGSVAAAGESNADAEGTFTVSFPSPAGSFNEYTVELTADGVLFRTLSNIVFGEVWLSSGQSNMQYTYAEAEDYVAPADAVSGEKRFIRLFYCPGLVEYNGAENNLPALPQNEIPGCCWFDANDSRCDGFSAVSYFFALDLAKTLDVPLGVVALPLGGSSILTWLPREAVEGSPAITERAKQIGQYYTLEDWVENGVNFGEDGPTNFSTMTTQYNKKTYAVRNFRFSGMLWYQGESDIGWIDAEYAEAMDLMQDSYTDLFHRTEPLPLIWTQLASYYYSNNENNTLRNIAFADMQQERPDSRALVTSYDYPATYYESAGAIHPMTKRPVGERMSFAAQRLVYGKPGDWTLPTVASYRIENGGISVTLRDTGDGLVCGGASLRGFSIAGDNGVYVRADAEITGENTVFLHADEVPAPAGAAYAFAITGDTANLYASENGEKTLPVSPFLLNREALRVSYQNDVWTECEEAQSWHSLRHTGDNAFYDTWTAQNATAQIIPEAAYEGAAGLRVRGNGCFSVSPVFSLRDGVKQTVFSDLNDDWRNYASVSVMLRNDGERDVILQGLQLQAAWFFLRNPIVAGTEDTVYVLPADGAWHRVTFDLDRVYAADALLGPPLDGSDALEYITFVSFRFQGKDAAISLDDIRFTPRQSERNGKLESFKNVALWILNPIKTLMRLIERIKTQITLLQEEPPASVTQ